MASVMVRVDSEGEGNRTRYASCGGSVINDRYILTAAHCLPLNVTASDVRITLFAHTSADRISLPKAAVSSILRRRDDPSVHVSESARHHDVGLIRLRERLSFSDSFSPVCLSPDDSWRRDSSIAGSAFVTGWGLQGGAGFLGVSKKPAAALTESTTAVLEARECERRYGDAFSADHEICAGTAACQGDSGGPLAVRSRDARVHQVGVVSFGPRTCNLLLFLGPTVYERIDAHLKWILDHTTDASYCSG